jgi:hypothetical protein
MASPPWRLQHLGCCRCQRRSSPHRDFAPAHERRPPKIAKAGANKGRRSRSPMRTTNTERGVTHRHRRRRKAPANTIAASASSRASGAVRLPPVPCRRQSWPPPRRPVASVARNRRRIANPAPPRPYRVVARCLRACRAGSRGPALWIWGRHETLAWSWTHPRRHRHAPTGSLRTARMLAAAKT